VKEIMLSQPNLLELEAPLKIVGKLYIEYCKELIKEIFMDNIKTYSEYSKWEVCRLKQTTYF